MKMFVNTTEGKPTVKRIRQATSITMMMLRLIYKTKATAAAEKKSACLLRLNWRSLVFATHNSIVSPFSQIVESKYTWCVSLMHITFSSILFLLCYQFIGAFNFLLQFPTCSFFSSSSYRYLNRSSKINSLENIPQHWYRSQLDTEAIDSR